MTDTSQPLVTMAVSGYNQSAFILDTLRSIEAQTYPNIEVVVVDGGGSDGMDALAQEFLAKSRFLSRFHRQAANLGMVQDRHKAFELSRGEFVCFLDADDVAFPNRVAKQLQMLLENDCDAVYGNLVRLYDDGTRVLNREPPVMPPGEWDPETFVARLVGHKGPMAQAGLFRRSLLEEIGGIDQGFKMNDWPFMIEAARKARRMLVSRDPVFYYRNHAGSHHTQHLVESMRWRIEVIRHYCSGRLAGRAIGRCYRAMADKQLRQGDLRSAVRSAAKAAAAGGPRAVRGFTGRALSAALRRQPASPPAAEGPADPAKE